MMRKENDFILSAKPNNDDINILEVADIEKKLLSGVTLEEAKIFLDYVVYNSRLSINYDNPVNITDFSFYGQCGIMANFNRALFQKLGLNYHQFNVGNVVCNDTLHEVITVSIPIITEEGIVNKEFLIDPSIRQFFTRNVCDFSLYYGEKRGNIRVAAPSAGYFFCLSDYGINLASNLIVNGYMEFDLDNIKYYFDAFKLSTIGKEFYPSDMVIGKYYLTDISVSWYIEKIKSLPNSFFTDVNAKCLPYLHTATEVVARKNLKFVDKLKQFFTGESDSSHGYHR